MAKLWRHLILGGALAVAAGPSAALAQAPGDRAAAAQALFDEAMGLVRDGKYAAACPKLEESQRLDPGLGTQFRLAECYERVGRLASAWALFIEVADAAQQQGNQARDAQARARAEALSPALAKLKLVVPPDVSSVAGLVIKRDGAAIGQALWGASTPVDPGEHTVEAVAPGKKTWTSKVNVPDRGRVDVAIPALDDAPVPPAGAGAPSAPTEPTAPAGSTGMSSLQLGGLLGAAAVSVAGLVVGGVFGVKAKSRWDETLDHCLGRDTTKCDADGIALGGEARTAATISTVGFVGAGVGLAAAGAIGLVALSSRPSGDPPRAGVRVVPGAGSAVLGGTVLGRF